MLKWIRRAMAPTTDAEPVQAKSGNVHQAMLGEGVVYFAHTVPTSKRIDLGKAAKYLLDTELAVSAAWPSDESARIPPSLERIERDLAHIQRLETWTDNVNGLRSLAKGVFLHPVIAFRTLQLLKGNRNQMPEDDEAHPSLETIRVEVEKILVDAQKVTLLEKEIDADLFWSESEDLDAYVRFFLRTTQHTIRIGDKDRTITLEPRLLLHREGVAQITVGVHLPVGCTPAEVIDASFPASPLFYSSRIPEPYASAGSKWAGGEWSEQPEGGVRVRVFEHEEPASLYDWLEVLVGRIMRGVGAFVGGPSYTYPMIMVQAGACCTDWADNHANDIVHLAIRSVPRGDDQITLGPGPDLSIHTGMRIHATGGSVLLLHLRTWRAGILDLHHTLLYERIGLVYVRLRRLEQRVSEFQTGKRDIARTYRRALELEKEVRGAHHRSGTARDISRHVLTALGAFEILEVVRTGSSMLGERASTRASLRAARAANRFALIGLVVAVFAAIPAIPAILSLIEQQRVADPEAGIWSVMQTLATSPLLLSALILGAAVLYGVVLFGVLAFRVIRYLFGLRKRGYVSRVEGYEIVVDDPADAIGSAR
ncbi:hypothetical protein QMG61_10545 [Cryobacterium sp. PH31-AA6]|uniref:hypothetical protein n=1 Tax=Cryobacterium sp. PH31-AA6 TaxID=3046205 RepID=UPI0024BB2153|nr:hypothetical protein [Cryobacterium sp. PH31-AA6]MDJ0324203.1 hypothetical protein [Cryobacterium sp. PH31-AA6]